MYGGMKVQRNVFLKSALAAGKWFISRRVHFRLGKTARYPQERRLSGFQIRSGLRDEGKTSSPGDT